MVLVQVYKEEQLLLGLEPYKLPILVTGGIIAAKIEFSNLSVKFYGGKLTSFAVENVIGEVYGASVGLSVNKAKYLNISMPYFPNTYQLEFLASEWLRGRQFNLIIWEQS